jgi:hypothetical protein
VSPSSLAESILEQLEEARDGYALQLDFDLGRAARKVIHSPLG